MIHNRDTQYQQRLSAALVEFACESAGGDIAYHFADVSKMVEQDSLGVG